MTNKQALKQLEEYCQVNDLHLLQGSYNNNTWAFASPDDQMPGNRVIDYDGNYYTRMSGYMKPTELLIWLDGYHAGKQVNNK